MAAIVVVEIPFNRFPFKLWSDTTEMAAASSTNDDGGYHRMKLNE